MLTITCTQNLPNGSATNASMVFVDLAGSEKVRLSGSSGVTLDEAKKINQSLSQLNNVIRHLKQKPRPAHIPFRDSKLTHLLKESLGGNSKTTLICTISRKKSHAEESV